MIFVAESLLGDQEESPPHSPTTPPIGLNCFMPPWSSRSNTPQTSTSHISPPTSPRTVSPPQSPIYVPVNVASHNESQQRNNSSQSLPRRVEMTNRPGPNVNGTGRLQFHKDMFGGNVPLAPRRAETCGACNCCQKRIGISDKQLHVYENIEELRRYRSSLYAPGNCRSGVSAQNMYGMSIKDYFQQANLQFPSRAKVGDSSVHMTRQAAVGYAPHGTVSSMDAAAPFRISAHAPNDLSSFSIPTYSHVLQNLTNQKIESQSTVVPPALPKKRYRTSNESNSPKSSPNSSPTTESSLVTFMNANGYSGSSSCGYSPNHLAVNSRDNKHSRVSSCSSYCSSNRSTYGSSGELPSDISSFDSNVYRGAWEEKKPATKTVTNGEYVFMETVDESQKSDGNGPEYSDIDMKVGVENSAVAMESSNGMKKMKGQHEYVFIDNVDSPYEHIRTEYGCGAMSPRGTCAELPSKEVCDVKCPLYDNRNGYKEGNFAGVHKGSYNKYKHKFSTVRKPPKLNFSDFDLKKYQLPRMNPTSQCGVLPTRSEIYNNRCLQESKDGRSFLRQKNDSRSAQRNIDKHKVNPVTKRHYDMNNACTSALCESTYSVNSILSETGGTNCMCRQCGGISAQNSPSCEKRIQKRNGDRKSKFKKCLPEDYEFSETFLYESERDVEGKPEGEELSSLMNVTDVNQNYGRRGSKRDSSRKSVMVYNENKGTLIL